MKSLKSFSKRSVLLLYLFQFVLVTLMAQDPKRFDKEIHNLVAGDSTISKRKLILFTGSSSIRFWSGLRKDFPNRNVLNRGFGGSEMSDLLYYAEPLILNYNPRKIFIYEGDNDINSGKSTEEILANADKLLILLRAHLPAKVKIIFISAKPSIARWHLKEKYEEFNRKLMVWTSTRKNVLYADVWTPMLDSTGAVRKDLFVEDNLHMNQVGYTIWATVIGKLI